MTNKNNLKIAIKGISLGGSDEVATIKSSLFIYSNYQVNWFATDYVLSALVPEKSKEMTAGRVRYFLNFLDSYEQLDGDHTDNTVPLGLVTDAHLRAYVKYIETDLGLNRNAIVLKVRTALNLLKFIQDNYYLDYLLISISDTDGKFYQKGLVNAEWRVSSYAGKYLAHQCIPHSEDYPTRDPITEDAIESLLDDLDNFEDENSVKDTEYKHALLAMLIDLLEKTGVRVSEAANINSHTVELLRAQELALMSGRAMDVDELIKSEQSGVTVRDIQAAEAIYRNSKLITKGTSCIWIKIQTTKGKNKNSQRLIPIPRPTAKRIISFYDTYIVGERDRVNKGRSRVKREQYKKLFVHASTHQPMRGTDISKLYYEVFSRNNKSPHRRFPHLFRHRFITILVYEQLRQLNRTMGTQFLAKLVLKRIQNLTGHASIETMMNYVKIAEGMLEKELRANEDEVFGLEAREILVSKLGEEAVIKIEAEVRNSKLDKS
ncbi:hypothetical protein UA38_15190 [Photobacterium kishitanii]|uniref:Site-specific integrase n=1 Tax=Photobacterium kishitanii TaxID=318456 RepID=A0AAX0YYR1_9GAMM|nr:site-specific integrase [Photobacterium kishitanii]KJG56364.1 hypothetical protein UA38_15190 [Photobacterium kishitanii]KJG60228.1 hypothetical protein UA42_16795 [Photobacterium kishitanii]KJG64481.1 hypothetical protein UA40_16590 [Photobacterium kishitanii]KJG68665.1 hypothetical protein UA41_16015 [Photobacterium kishitanii]PSX17854.1 site-specific integrase [Photobacterium kishitanii]